MTDADGLRLEAAEQFGFMGVDPGAGAFEGAYSCTTTQLLAFAKACERAGMVQAHGMGSRDLVAQRIAAIDIELTPILETERARTTPPLSRLHHHAMTATQAFEDAASYEETQWTGWGDCVVPPHAEMRRVKAQQAVCALRDAVEPESQP